MVKHPDYDIDFKPAIARYDWDQTYDVLEFVYLPQGFHRLGFYGIPAFELMAIERYTPYNYLWADQYSDKLFNFLKTFNFSPHNSIDNRYLKDETGIHIFYIDSNLTNYKGEWLPNTSYTPKDIVKLYGRYYVARSIFDYTLSPDKDFHDSWRLLIYRDTSWYSPSVKAGHVVPYFDADFNENLYVALTDNSYEFLPENESYWLPVGLKITAFEYSGSKYSKLAEYKAKFVKGEYILTGLNNEGREEDVLEQNVDIDAVISQFYYKFVVEKDDTEIDINKILVKNNICANSIIISKKNSANEWEEYNPTFTSNKPLFLFFSDFDFYFTSIKQELLSYFSNTFSTYSSNSFNSFFVLKYNDNWNGSFTEATHNQLLIPYEFNLHGYIKKVTIDTLGDNGNITKLEKNITVEYDTFPNYMVDFCYLQRANNNKWETGLIYSDLGIIPSVKIPSVESDTVRLTNLLYTNNKLLEENKALYKDNPRYVGNFRSTKYSGHYSLDQLESFGYFKPIGYYLLNYAESDDQVMKFLEDSYLPDLNQYRLDLYNDWYYALPTLDRPSYDPPDDITWENFQIYILDNFGYGDYNLGFFSYHDYPYTFDGGNTVSAYYSLETVSPFTSVAQYVRPLSVRRLLGLDDFFREDYNLSRNLVWIQRGYTPFIYNYGKKVINEVSGKSVKGVFDWGFYDKLENLITNIEYDFYGNYEIKPQISTEVVLLNASEFTEYANIVHISQENFLNYLLQLKEEWEEEDQRIYEEEQNA
ncbi:hypothetical protein [Cyanobacterium aponinum]|uniref:hypothetical protein n=1 Tax=Cyanobacterium aponinum TaxID=379064 RepID=UPI000C12AE61|nr:hypothetical protein [Cyanobacterium aponinum]PHV63195.1 hypothetical protein CSQ80_06580 [Cyanobacterium aponinum IPPAS B-1201]